MARIHTPRIESLHPAFRVITLFLLIATLVVFAQGLVGSPRLGRRATLIDRCPGLCNACRRKHQQGGKRE